MLQQLLLFCLILPSKAVLQPAHRQAILLIETHVKQAVGCRALWLVVEGGCVQINGKQIWAWLHCACIIDMLFRVLTSCASAMLLWAGCCKV